MDEEGELDKEEEYWREEANPTVEGKTKGKSNKAGMERLEKRGLIGILG